jgi:LysM domain-containing protein
MSSALNTGRSQLLYWQRVQTLQVSKSRASPQPEPHSFLVFYGTVLVANRRYAVATFVLPRSTVKFYSMTGPHADSAVVRATRAADRRGRRVRRRNRGPSRATLYVMAVVAIIALAVLVQFAVHTVRTDPRDSRAIALRELQVNTLEPGERVLRMVSVFKRPAISYFRATRGLLALTNKRLLYIGVEPRDLLAAPDLPPTFEERDFALDTMVHVTSGRTFFGLARAVVITLPNEKIKLGVPSAAGADARLLVVAMDVRRERAIALSAQQKALLARAEADRKAAEASRRQAKYYVVRRGDALGGIATIWNTTTDRLREWNKLPDNKIRVGQKILVRPAL